MPIVSSSSSSPTAFVNFAYVGKHDDKAGTSLDRTREGYVEIIEMGDVVGSTAVCRHPRERRSAVHESALQAPVAPNNTVAGHGRPVRQR